MGTLREAVESRGLTPQQFTTLKQVVWPNAKSDDSVMMALDYCKSRGLDPFKKPVHIVPVWDKDAGGLVDTVRPGISELRTTAMRTGEYLGKDEVRFGPEATYTLGDKTLTVPEYAQVTVYRLVAGRAVPFPGDPVYFLESYATASRKSDAPNAMWEKRPRGQLAKNAEANALRIGFPEEIGGENSAEEMEGQHVAGAGRTFDHDHRGADGTATGSGATAASINEAVEGEAQQEPAQASTPEPGPAEPAALEAEPASAPTPTSEWDFGAEGDPLEPEPEPAAEPAEPEPAAEPAGAGPLFGAES